MNWATCVPSGWVAEAGDGRGQLGAIGVVPHVGRALEAADDGTVLVHDADVADADDVGEALPPSVGTAAGVPHRTGATEVVLRRRADGRRR